MLGSNLISNVLHWKNAATGKTVKAACCSKEKQKSDPLWKVRELLDELNKQANDMWVPG